MALVNALVWRRCLMVLGAAVVGAGQDTRTVSEPVFPPVCTKIGARLSAGAAGLSAASETQFDTAAIQGALDSCPRGQAVQLQAAGINNAFLIAPIRIPAGVTLLVDAGVTVYGSRNPRDYDANAATTCGTITANSGGCVPLITASRADGGGIMGYGAIDGRGQLPMLVNGSPGVTWWDLARQAQAVSQNQNNPRMLQISNTNGFTLYKITLRNSPNFHVAMGTSTNITVWGVKVITPYDARNTDAIDPGYSSNVTITRCHISTGDDNVAVGGGSSPGATNISVVDNWFGDGHGASIGSYTQYGVSNILFDRITIAGNSANGSQNGIRIKSDVSRGGVVQNITYSNFCMRDVRYPILLDPFYTSGATGNFVPQYKNITMRNVHALTRGPMKFQGHDPSVPTTVTLSNVQIDGVRTTDIAQQYTTYTLGPDPVNFASMLAGTGVTVIDSMTTANAPYACPAEIFSPIAGELIPLPPDGRHLSVMVQVFPAKALPFATYKANLMNDPGATLDLPAPTGTVTIYDGARVAGIATLAGSPLLSVPVRLSGRGTHTLTATYSGDSNYASITFGGYRVKVRPPRR
jgi:hypothetical protein